MVELNIIYLVYLLAMSETQAVPHKWSGIHNFGHVAHHDNRFLNDSHRQLKISTEVHHRVTNVREANNKSDGKIVFPADELHSQLQQHNFTPAPACKNSTFCEHVPNYPSELVSAALERHEDLKLLTGADWVPEVVHRNNFQPEDIPLCGSQEKVVYPQIAQKHDNKWALVVNNEKYIQGVRVEICGNENGACDIIDGARPGYSSTCKQKYIYRKLVSFSGSEIEPALFRLPSSCCCHLNMDGNIESRINSSEKSDSTLSKI